MAREHVFDRLDAGSDEELTADLEEDEEGEERQAGLGSSQSTEEYEGAEELQAEVRRRAKEAEEWEAAATQAWEAQLMSSTNWQANLDMETPEAREAKSAAVAAAAWRAALSVAGPWQALPDPDSGRPYYWNRKTNSVRWDVPTDVQPAQHATGHRKTVPATDSDDDPIFISAKDRCPEELESEDPTQRAVSNARRMRWSQLQQVAGKTEAGSALEELDERSDLTTPVSDAELDEVPDLVSNVELSAASGSDPEQEEVPDLISVGSAASANEEEDDVPDLVSDEELHGEHSLEQDDVPDLVSNADLHGEHSLEQDDVPDLVSNADLHDDHQEVSSSDSNVPSLVEADIGPASQGSESDIEEPGIAADAQRFLQWKRKQFRSTSDAAKAQKLRAKAQAALEHAMAVKDIASLESALDDAQDLRLSLELLEAARAILKEEQWKAENRRRRARTGLRDAVTVRDVQILATAIEEAEQAMLSDEELHDAKEIYRDEERRESCTKALKQAIMFKEIECLSAAIEEGEAAGAEDWLLKNARDVLAEEEIKAEARERLQEAIQSRDQGEMWSAIYHAESSGLTEKELDHARTSLEKLAEEDGTEQARDALQDAIARRDMNRLGLALDEAEKVGIANEELEHARSVLAEEENKIKLRRKLMEAIASRKIEQLNPAIEEGQDGGLSDKELAMARQVLHEEDMKISARKRLFDAIESQDQGALELAIGFSRQAGLPEDLLEPAKAQLHDALEKAERSGRVQALLEKAIREQHLPSVRTILKEGQGLVLPSSLLEEAKAILDQEEQQEAARQRLARAVRTGKVDSLRAALEEARSAKVAESDMNVAMVSLQYAENAEKESQISQKVAARDLRSALQKQDLDAIRSAISACEAAGLPESEIQPGRLAVASEGQKAEARLNLEQAIFIQDAAALSAAISSGTEAGLKEEELRPAVNVLQAISNLEAAISSRDIDSLRSALAAGEDAELELSQLDEARALLALLQRKAAAVTQLRQALCLCIHRRAIDQLKWHAERQQLEDARRRKLISDMNDKLQDLRLAVKSAEHQGLGPRAMKPARRALAEAKRNLRLQAEWTMSEEPAVNVVDSAPGVFALIEADPVFARQVLEQLVEPELAGSNPSLTVLVQEVRKIHSDPAALQAALQKAAAACAPSMRCAKSERMNREGSQVSGVEPKAQVAEFAKVDDVTHDLQDGKCPAGHKLKEFTTSHGRFSCDKCDNVSLSGAKWWSCRQCDYDLCSNCRATLEDQDSNKQHGRKARPFSQMFQPKPTSVAGSPDGTVQCKQCKVRFAAEQADHEWSGGSGIHYCNACWASWEQT